MVAVSACLSGTRGTRGSGVLSSTGDMRVRGVGGVCDMCMCLARGGVGGEGGEWMRELDLEPENVNFSITTREPPKRMMKETLFTRYRSAVEPLMIAKDRRTTLQAIHTMAVDQAVTSLGRNVLDDRPPEINISETEITWKERTTLAQLRSGHCRLLVSYKSRISKDVSLDVCADCGKTPHDVKHLFNCPAHPTTVTPSELWNRPVDAIRELGYLEAGVLD